MEEELDFIGRIQSAEWVSGGTSMGVDTGLSVDDRTDFFPDTFVIGESFAPLEIRFENGDLDLSQFDGEVLRVDYLASPDGRADNENALSFTIDITFEWSDTGGAAGDGPAIDEIRIADVAFVAGNTTVDVIGFGLLRDPDDRPGGTSITYSKAFYTEDREDGFGISSPILHFQIGGTLPPINGTPRGVDDEITVAPETPVIIDVLANDLDPEGDALFVDSFSEPSNGTLTDLGNGRFEYQPDPEFIGNDFFSYEISDGNSISFADGLVSIMVDPGADAPDLVPGLTLEQTDWTPNDLIALTAEIQNAGVADAEESFVVDIVISEDGVIDDGDQILSVETLGGLPSGASAEIELLVDVADLLIGGIPSGTYFVGVAADSLDAIDETNEANNFTTTEITLDSLAANDDEALLGAGEFTEIDVLDNDAFPADAELTIEIESQPFRGLATVIDNKIRYEFTGSFEQGQAFSGDQFAYKISDETGQSDTAEVSIVAGPDFAVSGLYEIRLIENGVPGAETLRWGAGDQISLAQTFVNLGADEARTPPINFALRKADGPVVTTNMLAFADAALPFEPFGPFDDGVTERDFSYGLTLDEFFYRVIKPGAYHLEAWINEQFFANRDALLPDADASNNSTPFEEQPVILIFKDTVVERSPGAAGETTTGTDGNDLVVDPGRPRGNTTDLGFGEDTQAFLDALRSDLEEQFLGSPGPLGATGGATGGAPGIGRLELPEDAVVQVTDIETGLTDTLISVERLSLADGAYLYDLEGDDLPFVYRVYDAAFARTPDEPGLRFWAGQVASGNVDRNDLAQFFVDSGEFDRLFPSSTDEEFIEALYLNALRREPDDEGEAFWLGVFESGTQTRADMLEFFANSPENVERNADNYDDGVWVI